MKSTSNTKIHECQIKDSDTQVLTIDGYADFKIQCSNPVDMDRLREFAAELLRLTQ